jgi:hypothetical protein
VIGGLYGNLPALDAIEAMCAREQQPVTLCFNGDFNWFNVDDAGFPDINERVLRHDAILGNVEAELQAATDSVRLRLHGKKIPPNFGGISERCDLQTNSSMTR